MIDNKDFLTLIWQQRMFTGGELCLTDGTLIEIVSPGYSTQGVAPDFSHAAIKLIDSGVTLYGSIKVDARSSDWRRDGTVEQPAFDNVILHFVGQCDVQVMLRERLVPTLVAHVPEFITDGVRSLARECEPFLASMESVFRENFLSRIATDRLARKSDEMLEILKSVDGDWPCMAMIGMIRSMGFRETKAAYKELSNSIPYYVIRDRACDLISLEALFFGQAGYLDDGASTVDEYVLKLRDIYTAQRGRFELGSHVTKWHQSATRPQSQPQLQLARMAAILHNERSLFERIVDETDYISIRRLFRTQLGEYWQSHNALGEPYDKGTTIVTEQRIDLFIINFVVPFLHAYGRFINDQGMKERAEDFLVATAAEGNTYVKRWIQAGYTPTNAYYSQALIQLATMYCSGSHCVQCPLGANVLLEYYRKYTRALKNHAIVSNH